MAAQSFAVMTAPSGPSAALAVRCDQAVFTSVHTSTGQGYRIIAASPGVTPEERNEISARSPSHGGLCAGGEDACGSAFYALKSGRLCASLSCAAGREQTGRGGLRIFTRAAVFAASDLARFGNNPFNVLRAMQAEGLDRPELELPAVAPQVMLRAVTARESPPWKRAAALGPQWLSYVLGAAVSDRAVVLAGDREMDGALETVVMAVPAPLRRCVSFSRGLKFSIGRPFTINEIWGETATAERVIRGHPITLLRPATATAPPRSESCEWERMAEQYWSRGAFAELEEFCNLDFPDCSEAVLERIAGIRNEIGQVAGIGEVELLALAGRRIGEPDGGDIETRLLSQLLADIRARLEGIWSHASLTELAAAWPRVRDLMLRAPAGHDFATTLAGMILRRLSSVAPLKALDYSLSISDEPLTVVINADLREVVTGLESWMATATPAEMRPIADKLKRWRIAYPHIEHAGIVHERMNERAKA